MEALNTPQNEPWWEVFSKKSSGPSESGNFQIVPCKQDASGEVTMGMGCFHFQGKSVHERWFWFEYNADSIDMFKASQVATLDKDVYSQVRQLVLKKLGDNAKAFIGSLHLNKKPK